MLNFLRRTTGASRSVHLSRLGLLWCVACTPAVRVAPAPQWCTASSAASGLMTACASADSERLADERAISQLARQLAQEVTVRETSTRSEESQRNGDERRQTRSSASAMEEVQAVALARLLGARVQERVHVGATYYALASLDLRQVTRRVSATTDEALSLVAQGDVVRALAACRDAQQQARNLPVLFAEVDANVGRCRTMSDAIYEHLAIAVLADTLFRVTLDGRPVAQMQVQVRRNGPSSKTAVVGESDRSGQVRRAKPRAMVSGGSLVEDIDVVWDGLDDVLESRPFRPRARLETEFPGRTVSVTVSEGLGLDDETKLLAALRREFGEGRPSSRDGNIWIVKLSARVRNEDAALGGVRSASATINWQLVRVGTAEAVAQGGVVDERAVGLSDTDAHTAVLLRAAARVAESLERALAQSEHR